MTVYVVAQSTAPAIWCPPWCERTDEHVDELHEWDGRAVHAGYWPFVVDRGPALRVARTLLADGSAEPEDRFSHVTVEVDGVDLTVEQAERFRAFLDEAICAAKAEQERA